MQTATLEIAKNVFVGKKPHEAVFTILNLDDGSTAPLGRFKRVAVESEAAAREWAEANSIRIIQGQVDMCSADDIATDEAADLILAESYGWYARKEGTASAPAQCKDLQPLLAKYNGPVGSSSVLLALLQAWSRGYHSCHAELVGLPHQIRKSA